MYVTSVPTQTMRVPVVATVLVIVLLAFRQTMTLARFGDRKKSDHCPVVFVVGRGVNNTRERGRSFTVDKSYSDPRVDDDGVGSRYASELRAKFSCVAVVPVKTYSVYATRSEIEKWCVRECHRRKRHLSCFVLSADRDMRSSALNVVRDVQHVADIVRSLKIKTYVNKEGIVTRKFEFTRRPTPAPVVSPTSRPTTAAPTAWRPCATRTNKDDCVLVRVADAECEWLGIVYGCQRKDHFCGFSTRTVCERRRHCRWRGKMCQLKIVI